MVIEKGAVGLARIAARDQTTLVSLNAAQTASPEDLLAPEVETIRFRYFARGNWFDRWDSAGRLELPQAVEMTIGFRQRNAPNDNTRDRTPTGEYRLVVPVLASEA